MNKYYSNSTMTDDSPDPESVCEGAPASTTGPKLGPCGGFSGDPAQDGWMDG